MEEKRMTFGRRYAVGSYTAIKYNRTLRKQEVAQLRSQMGIPKDMRNGLQRAQLPYIRVEASSGIWAVEFCCNTAVYNFIDKALGSEGSLAGALSHLFNRWFLDTTLPGDEEYVRARAEAMKAFMERQKAAEVSDEEDGRILEQVKAAEEARATVLEMANEVAKGGGDED